MATHIRSRVKATGIMLVALLGYTGVQTCRGSDEPASQQVILVAQPSAPGLQDDLSKLKTISAAGDLKGLLSETDALVLKWQDTNKPCLWSVLTEACSDLESDNFGFTNTSSAHAAREKFAGVALANSDGMPLSTRAYFVECLSYVPGGVVKGPTGDAWKSQRSQRTAQWLGIWTQVNQLLAVSHPYPNMHPDIPEMKGWHGPSINGYTNPAYIEDPKMRAAYVAAIDTVTREYHAWYEQHQAQTIQRFFVPLAKRYLSAAYSTAPDDLAELKLDLQASGISAADQQDILGSVGSPSGSK